MVLDIEDRDLRKSLRLAWIAIIAGAIGMLLAIVYALFAHGGGANMAKWAFKSKSPDKASGEVRSSISTMPPLKLGAPTGKDLNTDGPLITRSEGPLTAPVIEPGAIPPSQSGAWKDAPAVDTSAIPDSASEFEKTVNEMLASKPAEFRLNNATLTWNGKTNLDLLIPYLRAKPHWRFEIGVHVAPGDNPQADQTLSKERAEAITSYFSGESGLGGRLIPKGYGSTKPIADNKTEIGRLKNQRVEIKVLGNN